MLTSQTLILSRSRGAAASARTRLLQDSAMRRNRDGFANRAMTLGTPHTVTFAVAATEPDITQLAPDADRLSPAEQRQRALQIARSFKDGYLADFTYLAERGIAVATVHPLLAQHSSLDVPHRVCVDADGNVSVLRLGADAAQRLVLSRLLLVVGAAAAALGALSALTLM